MISKPVAEMLVRNKTFAKTYQTPPTFQQFAPKARASRAGITVISCSDPRLNPDKILGLDATLGATHIRNAGGRALDAMRSLAILQNIGGSGTIVVMHHTDCGTTHFTDEELKNTLLARAEGHEKEVDAITWDAIATKPIEQSVTEDVEFLKNSALIMKDTNIIGLKYDIKTGLLTEVKETKS